MGRVRRACSVLKARWLERIAARPLSVRGRRGVITFTFDDVPRTAVDNAIPVLESAGIQATLYVALAMEDDGGPYLDESDVAFLAAHGHEIGCHTLTHYALRRGTAEGLFGDARDGKRVLEMLLDGRPVEHFSYPYGQVTVAAKKRLQALFRTMRTSTPGLNLGRVDRNFLRAQPVYSARTSLRQLRSLMSVACARGGWLILYTHDVTPDPDAYGTSIRDFRTIVRMAEDSGARLATMSDALETLATYHDRPLT